ncbi:amino acid/amide ABC transporter ATP-binding protein 1, HAAT family [Desulfacinum hydrothermale DSM 13146]|uniref:Amino acid/amide ABC transporter ATP-binding protein 1, HAAT family n=1 Tax=Desulfacinum hydrothermale DSM 13146 TaxID=1121390 RepID=A0A1W1XN59_9BACT|nr:ABC transporter ATP-binding protein [Desulfacinum hydrothermale]SMC25285.1 amino acid/amide ABC transporter ATP-binding protein 1, HAAT family [Desulfacinum hydrothermale DSM 13146]
MTPLLRVERMTKTFDALVANREVSFQVNQGDLFGIIGPNGAGKTTLFNCIAGRYAPTSGRIFFDNRDVTSLSAHQMARLGLARTFQVYAASGDLTVLENVMVGCFLRTRSRFKARQRASEILEEFGLADLADTLLVEVPVAYQKLVTAATAVATRPKLLLLDEVAAGLNPTEVEQIMAMIRHINQNRGITVILIEHVMTLVMNLCHRIMVLDSGEKIAEGPPEEVAALPAVIKAYLGERYVQTQLGGQ